MTFGQPGAGLVKCLSPVIDEIADELGDQAKVVKVNVDENPELSQTIQNYLYSKFTYSFKNGTLKAKAGGGTK